MEYRCAIERAVVSRDDLRSRMTEYVRRDVNVVSVSNPGLSPYNVYAPNGTAWNFAVINSVAELDSMIANPTQPDGYVINDNIITIHANVELPDNIYMTGWQLEYQPGHFIALTPQKSTISAPANSDLFIVGNNNTIRDVNLSVTQTAGTDAYFMLKNTGADTNNNIDNPANQTGSSVGTLTIDSITANGQIFMAIGDFSTNSTISITNSTFNMGSTSGIVTNNAAIDLETWNNSNMIVNAVDNNTIIFLDNAGAVVSNNTGPNNPINTAFGILINNQSGTQTIISVSGNHITFGDYAGVVKGTNSVTQSSSGAGISFSNYSGTQTIGANNNNTVIFGDYANNAEGISFYNQNTQSITTNNDNTVTFGDYASNVQGIYF